MTEGHSIMFKMCEKPWQAPVIIFDDGQTKLNRHLLHPDRPVTVLLEGVKPTGEQVLMCRHLWQELYSAMDFRVASFCPALQPYYRDIMAPEIVTIPA
ncbi:hypothetical protein [Tardiphaga robiniae]|uniref:Uncharacterized protein n=1 Tax=Tardiphaga robiniae TaxID=943830 RepID=A0A7G6TVN1_9BRAD|nr:hypothetical protein [Tardiphaga robiniae]QND70813.1 hypothetical protein HB776_05870 [Tardiphaga robiniae]